MRDYRLYLKDILAAMESIEAFVLPISNFQHPSKEEQNVR
jgi:uncharacterized protein with HEPN domain